MLSREGIKSPLTALLLAFLAAGCTSAAALPRSTNDTQKSQLLLSTVMQKAAYEFASVRVQAKTVQASRYTERANLLNSLSVSRRQAF